MLLNNTFTIAILMICGLLILPGFFGNEVKAAPPAPPLKLTAAPTQTEVTIGDWIVITLTFTNTTANKMDMIKPMLDIDSASFYIKTTPLSGNSGKSFVYSVITPSAYEHNRGQMAKVSLAAGAQVQETFKIPATTLGLWEITAYYQGFQRPISAEPLRINIITPKSDKLEKPKDGELIARIETSKGVMKCRFFFNDAPNTAMNFIRLSKEGFYNSLIFHRIMKGFMIQGGCPLGNGGGNPGYSIKGEFNAHKHLKGTLSMARSSRNPPTPIDNDSAGSQFFICHGAVSRLDNQYTAFGELIEGTDVLDALASVQTAPNPNNPEEISKPVENVFIKSVSLEFKETETKK